MKRLRDKLEQVIPASQRVKILEQNDGLTLAMFAASAAMEPLLGNKAALFYSQLGADFVKKLYIDQKPAISRDRRQMIDWLARGTYPICLTCRADDAGPLQEEGFRLLEVFELSGVQGIVNATPFLLTVASKAPHPNATRVFVNWMATREALEIYSRSYKSATLRNDADAAFRRNDFRSGLQILGQIAATAPDDSGNWLRLARTIFQIKPSNSTEQTFFLERASTAAYLAYQRAATPQDEADALEAELDRDPLTRRWRA